MASGGCDDGDGRAPRAPGPDVVARLRDHLAWLEGDPAGVRLVVHDDALAGVDLSGRVLREADMVGADLTGADVSGCDATDCDLSDATLVEVYAAGTRFDCSAFDGARLDNVEAPGSSWVGCSARDAVVVRSDLRGARVLDVDARGAVVMAVDLSRSVVRTVSVAGGAVVNARFDGAHVEDVDVAEADVG